MKFDKAYWSEKYENNLTGWDAGSITTPIKEYVDQLGDKGISILIPGCGYGHEAAYLHDQGFTKVKVIDISDAPIAALKLRCPNWSEEQFIVGDFFNHQGEYDLIIEQTFFCALAPSLREKYAKKISELLTAGGKLAGLLFTFPLQPGGPPFGGDISEYRMYFQPYFRFNAFESCNNSIKPRSGAELWMNLQKIN